MKVGITSDHRGYTLKENIKERLKDDYQFIDYGTDSKESVDYPDFAFKIGNAVVCNEVDYGIAICGSGIGISIACNKVKGIRCAKVSTEEEAKITRIDNDANIVAFSSKISLDLAINIVKTFLNTKFSNELRHVTRIDKIINYESNN